MYLNRKKDQGVLPTYDVEELSMEEALLVLTAEKEVLECQSAVFASHSGISSWSCATKSTKPADNN